MKASDVRVGREKQRYEAGRRLICGCVPVFGGNVVMIRSRKGDEWIFPKGGWESDETKEDAASRESLEEAGVEGYLGAYLGEFDFDGKRGSKNRLAMYEMVVETRHAKWGENRDRTEVPIETALSMCRREETKIFIRRLMIHQSKRRRARIVAALQICALVVSSYLAT